MKLNLGCRATKIPGYSGMDCDAHPGVDIVGDISDLSQFKDESIEAIYSSHVLEHFPHTRTQEVLEEWCRVLQKGGKLYLAVPDFDAVVAVFRSTGMSDWIRNFVWGDQGYKTAFHYTGFTEPILAALLKDAGFSLVERCDSLGLNPAPDCSDLSIRRTLLSGKETTMSVSLNMVATK